MADALFVHARRPGSKYYYDQGCRCDECREARSAYMREFRARNPEWYKRDLAKARARKASYRGKCSRCGSETRYNGGAGKQVSTLCLACNTEDAAERSRARRGTGPLELKILAFLGSGEARFIEIARGSNTPTNVLSPTLHRLRQYGFVERPRRGVYRAVRS